MLPSHVKNNISDLYALSKAKPRGQKLLLKNASDQTIHALCQCAYDLLTKKLPLTPGRKRQLKKHKSSILRLLHPGQSVTQRRRMLVNQKGGMIASIAAAVLSAIPALVSLFR